MSDAQADAQDGAALSLFDVFDCDPLPESRRGRTELALEVAIAAGEAAGGLTAEHGGLIGSARAGARALDRAERMTDKSSVYAIAQLLTPYRETLTALGLPVAAVAVPDPDAAPTGAGLGVPHEWLTGEFGTPGA